MCANDIQTRNNLGKLNRGSRHIPSIKSTCSCKVNKDRTSGDYIICACLLILMLQVEGLLMAGDSAPQYVTPLATPRKNGNG